MGREKKKIKKMACYTREDEDAFGSQQLSQDRDYFTYFEDSNQVEQQSPKKDKDISNSSSAVPRKEEETVLMKKQILRMQRRNALLKLCHPYAK